MTAAVLLPRRLEVPQPKPRITLFDHAYNELGELPQILSLDATDRKNDVGTGRGRVHLDTDAARHLLDHDGDVVPLLIESGGFRYPAQITDSEQSGSEDHPTLDFQFEHDHSHLRSRLAWPNATLEWLGIDLPFEVQIPPYDVVVLPARSAVAHYVDANFAPSPFRHGAPVRMVPQGPILRDTSPIVALAARMTPLTELWKQALADTGVIVDVTLWLPGDPQPAGLALTAATIVVDCRMSVDCSDDVEFSAAAGELLDPKVQRSSQRAGTVYAGGQSPDALNNLFDTPIDLGDLGTITFAFLKNLIAPFNRFSDEPAISAHGPFLKSEQLVQGGASAWTPDALQAIAQGYQDVRAKRRATFGVRGGLAGRIYGEDFQLGDKVAATLWGERFVETVDATTLTYSAADGARLRHAIGSDRIDEHPIATVIRRIKEVAQIASALNVSK